MAGGLLWGFFLLASFTLSQADTHIRRQQTEKERKKEKKFCFGVKSGANITLCGMFDITTETPSVSNHNKAICSAWKKKKKEAEWHEEKNWIENLCFLSHVCIFYMWTCSFDTYSHNMYFFFFSKNTSSWTSRGLIPPEVNICCIVSLGPVLFNYPAGSSAIFSCQCAVIPATLFPMREEWMDEWRVMLGQPLVEIMTKWTLVSMTQMPNLFWCRHPDLYCHQQFRPHSGYYPADSCVLH